MANSVWLKGSAIAFAMLLVGSVAGAMVGQVAKYKGIDYSDLSDYLSFLPLSLIPALISSWLAIMASAGLFGMALAEEDGIEPTLDHFKAALLNPWRFMPLGIAIGLVEQAICMPLFWWLGTWWTLAFHIVLMFVGPFTLCTIPLMVDKGWSATRSSRASASIGLSKYFSYFAKGFAAFWSGFAGMLLLGVGYLWTQPNYQRRIVTLYREQFPKPDATSLSIAKSE